MAINYFAKFDSEKLLFRAYLEFDGSERYENCSSDKQAVSGAAKYLAAIMKSNIPIINNSRWPLHL